METQISRWGNSLALRIPAAFAQEAQLGEGTAVELTLSDGRLVVSPARRKYTLEELVAGITDENLHGETDWGGAGWQRSVVIGRYVPDRGDLIWLTFEPHAGREQAGRRPALVLSPADYNRRTRLALVCPITSQVKGFPFEVALPPGLPIRGVVLADHIKNVDWLVRQVDYVGPAPGDLVADVLAKLAPLLGY